jgi:hypothetical protein
MTFDANGCINRIPRDLQLDDVELGIPPLYDDHILDQPSADYNVNSEEVERIFRGTNGGHILADSGGLPSYSQSSG